MSLFSTSFIFNDLFQINYWKKYRDEETDALQNIIELPKNADNLNHGLIIGLNATDWYQFNVQAYNTAGNGPKSSSYEQQTLNKSRSNLNMHCLLVTNQSF